MAEFVNVSANIRISNEEGTRVCSVTNVNPSVSAQTAAAFVKAIETLYNSSKCAGRLFVGQDIVS